LPKGLIRHDADFLFRVETVKRLSHQMHSNRLRVFLALIAGLFLTAAVAYAGVDVGLNGSEPAGFKRITTPAINSHEGEGVTVDPQGPRPAGKNPSRLLIALVLLLLLIGRIGRIRRTTGSAVGGILLPVFGLMFFPDQRMLLLILIPLGFLVGFILSVLVSPLGKVESKSETGRSFAFGGGAASGQWQGMKKPTKKFLSAADRKKIQKSVEAAGQQSSGKIAAMIVSASRPYPMANVLGATALSLPLSLVFTPIIGEGIGLYAQDMWVFAALFSLLFSLLYPVIDLFPWFKRVFISAADIAAAAEEAAATAFFKEGIYRAKNDAGVLIFISILERRVFLLAGRGINGKVTPNQWQRIVRHIISGIRQNRRAEAIREAVDMIGKLLKTHFPVGPTPAKSEKAEGGRLKVEG